jgi:hypothetical protein
MQNLKRNSCVYFIALLLLSVIASAVMYSVILPRKVIYIYRTSGEMFQDIEPEPFLKLRKTGS